MFSHVTDWQGNVNRLSCVCVECILDPGSLDELQLRLETAEEEFQSANLDGRIQELRDARISQVRCWNVLRK